VVVVSSSAYAFGRIDLEDPNYTSRTYRPWDGYNQSKLANRLFVHELARRLKEEGSAVKAFSVHPGGRLWRSKHACWAPQLFPPPASCSCRLSTSVGIIKTSIGDHIGFRASCFYALAGEAARRQACCWVTGPLVCIHG
jgi:NAD(P)-dependent dehydrogenase (short-subunit alcohol dehydrogenase family)